MGVKNMPNDGVRIETLFLKIYIQKNVSELLVTIQEAYNLIMFVIFYSLIGSKRRNWKNLLL